MKAELGADGFLRVQAETPLESYALKRWLDEPEPLGERVLVLTVVHPFQTEKPK